MSEAASAPPEETPGEDHTLVADELKHGQLVYLYGYIPVVAFGIEDDGTVEVAQFGGVEYHSVGDLSTKRGPRPLSALPEQPAPADRIAALESQVSVLLSLLQDKGVVAKAPDDAPEKPQESTSPFGVGGED